MNNLDRGPQPGTPSEEFSKLSDVGKRNHLKLILGENLSEVARYYATPSAGLQSEEKTQTLARLQAAVRGINSQATPDQLEQIKAEVEIFYAEFEAEKPKSSENLSK